VIDQQTCIGCHACTVACKTEHQVPLGVDRTWVKYIEKGEWPETRRFFSVMRCNHCTDAPCVEICPTSALFSRADGIVDFDTDRCIGCKSCMQACPYDALYIDPGENTAQKCNYCVHRVEVGLQPACVVVCPEQAIIAGDLDDPSSRIAAMVATEQLTQRAVEQGTSPNLWYRDADEASLDPLAAVDRGDGGIWSDPAGSWLSVDLTPPEVDPVNPAPPAPATVIEYSSDVPRVVYNKAHPAPWGWRVSSYFLTKGISAGISLALLFFIIDTPDLSSSWARWGAPLVAGIMLAATGVLLVADLKRPDRFFYLLTKGNSASWLVRGAWVLSAYAIVLALWFLFGVAGMEDQVEFMVWVSAVVAIGVAGYTAFLFGQAEARDLWQAPTLVFHMLAGAAAVGAGAGLIASLGFETSDAMQKSFATTLVVSVGVLGAISVVDLVSRHPTRNIAAAVHHMTRGAYATEWWAGGLVLGVLGPLVLGGLFLASEGGLWSGAMAGGFAMAGLWFADDAFVRAGQSVPLS
jgi:Fe-S-cluster-containing dehydrogenase component/formate-dependent nitrite reductase membrane component NrfD